VKGCIFDTMILVTGATGLLGSHLIYRLALEQNEIRALYRDKTRIEQVKSLFRYYSPDNYESLFSKIKWIQGDILEIVSLEDAMQGIKTVYHCAGMVSFEKKHFSQMIKINREGTANVVNTCLEFGVEKLCYVSSTSAIGGQDNTLTTEETKWKQSPNTSGYSISKYSAEKEVWRGIEEGLDCVIVNPSVIFGAGNWDESSLTIFRTVASGLRFYTKGQNGFVDARDVADIMVRLTGSSIKNERFLCVGQNVRFDELLTKIAIRLGKKPPTINTPKWLMGLTWRFSWMLSKFRGKNAAVTRASARTAFSVMEYDNSKIKKALSFEFRSLDEMIENSVNGKIA
jgi:nucleoside-diphosphate-sugar epimerase